MLLSKHIFYEEDFTMSDFNENNLPEEYRPISRWGYFGYQLLFSIPCVGFILLIVFSFSAKNVNLRNFARSYFCFIIVLVILYVAIFVLGGVGAALSGAY